MRGKSLGALITSSTSSSTERRRRHRTIAPIRWASRLAVVCVIASFLAPLQALGANAAVGPTSVNLEFDDGWITQYQLAYQQALQPHGVAGTFFVKSGNISTVAQGFMTWPNVQALASAGDDIGGKTVNASTLQGLSTADATAQVCNDRQAIFNHGITPIAFAYPNGFTGNTTDGTSVSTIVKNCGYGNGRLTGGLPSGSTFAEKLPPLTPNAYATRSWTQPGCSSGGGCFMQLSDMEAAVNNATNNGGGWLQIIINQVCDQTLDPTRYTACSASFRPIQLSTLNSFLDWVQHAGQSGGAPAGTSFDTAGHLMTAGDNSAPVTPISCNGAACSTSTYSNTVFVTFQPTDTWSGMSSTHYTTDGSTPTLSSPTYTGTAVPVTATTTVKYASWDLAGNAEGAHSQTIQVAPPPDNTPPTTAISCNGSPCTSTTYVGQVSVSFSATDNPGGWGVDKTYYTTDGSTPTTSSTIYTGPFNVSGTTTVKFFSTDLAGNAEQVQTQVINDQPAPITVSMTFDDGDLSQYQLAFQRALQPHGMHGTFFIPSGHISNPNYSGDMTWSNLSTLAAAGDEISGHTFDHVDLTSSSLTYDQKVYEVCHDRENLISHGLSPVTFAYPFGAYDSTAESIVQSCGYTAARRTGGVDINGQAPYYENIPPTDPFAVKAFTPPTPADRCPNGTDGCFTNLNDLESAVTTAAQSGTAAGGSLVFVFHQICSQTYDPSNYSFCSTDFRPTDLSTLTSFMDWLANAGQPGGAPAGAVVKTLGQVTTPPDTTPPTTTIACNGGSCGGWFKTSPVTVTLTATDAGGAGVAATYYTTDGSDPSANGTLYTGPFAVSSTATVKFYSTDNVGNAEAVHAQQIQIDTAAPISTIACNGSPCSSSVYSGSVQVTLSASDIGDSGVAATYYTTDGSTPTASSTVYAGPFTVSSTTTVKFFSTDVAGNAEAVHSQQIQFDTTAPTTTIACNGGSCGGWFNTAPVTVTLTATDAGGAGVAATYYTTDGSDPSANGTLYTGPFAVSSTATVKFYSADNFGNTEAVHAQQIQFDTTAPTTTITCNGSPCSSTAYGAAVQVALSATDTGGSGVNKTYYTTDGSTPTASSTVYASAFTVPSTTTVKFFSTDVAGNAEAVHSQQIQILAPSIGLSPNSGPGGTLVSISGSGFDANKTITATYGGSAVTLSGTTSTDGSGAFSGATFTVPASTGGPQTVQVTDASGNNATASFSLLAAVGAPSPTSGPAGTSVSISGTGFKANAALTASVGGTPATITSGGTSSANGNASVTFTVPSKTAGSYQVAISDGTNTAPSATSFTVFGTVTSTLVTSAVDSSGNGHATSTKSISTVSGSTYLVVVLRQSSLTTGDTAAVTGPFTAISQAGTTNNFYNTGTGSYLWAFSATGNGASGTVSVNFATSGHNDFTVIDVLKLSGNNTASSVAQATKSAGNSATASATLSTPDANNGEIVIAGANGNISISTPTGFTQLDYQHGLGGKTNPFAEASYVRSAAQASTSFTLGSSAPWGTIAIEVKHA